MFYVIEIQDCDRNITSYLAYDASSGGYPWFPSNMFSAHAFNDLNSARREYASMVDADAKPTEWAGGTLGAPSVMRAYAELSNVRQEGRFIIKLIALSGNCWSNIKPVILSAHVVTIQEFLKERKAPIIKSEQVT